MTLFKKYDWPEVAEVVGRVPSLSIIIMILSMIVGFAVIVGTIIHLKRRYKARISTAIWGIFIFFVFALIVQAVINAIVSRTPLQDVMNSNAYVYALYIAVVATLCEEIGKFLLFKYVIPKRMDNDFNGLMSASGFGAIEMLRILIPTMISSIALSSLINDGSFAKFMSEVEDEEAVHALVNSAKDLISENSLSYLIIPIERIAGFVITLSLTSWVWFAAKNKNKNLLLIAMGIHFAVTFVTLALNEGLGLNVYIIEALYLVAAVVIVIMTRKMFAKNTDGEFSKDKISDEKYLM